MGLRLGKAVPQIREGREYLGREREAVLGPALFGFGGLELLRGGILTGFGIRWHDAGYRLSWTMEDMEVGFQNTWGSAHARS